MSFKEELVANPQPDVTRVLTEMIEQADLAIEQINRLQEIKNVQASFER